MSPILTSNRDRKQNLKKNPVAKKTIVIAQMADINEMQIFSEIYLQARQPNGDKYET